MKEQIVAKSIPLDVNKAMVRWLTQRERAAIVSIIVLLSGCDESTWLEDRHKHVFIASGCIAWGNPYTETPKPAPAPEPSLCYDPSLNVILNGLNEADLHCRKRAQDAGLLRADHYVAYLSTQGNDAYCRILGLNGTKANNCGMPSLPTRGGPWHLLDEHHLLVATDIDQLTSGPCAKTEECGNQEFPACLSNPIIYDEFGRARDQNWFWAWTGTWPNGEYADQGSWPGNPHFVKTTCGINWSGTRDSHGDSTGLAGEITRTDCRWAAQWITGDSKTDQCHSWGLSIYCFEQ